MSKNRLFKFGILFLLILGLIPFALKWAHLEYLVTQFDSDWLAYYGSVLTFIGSVLVSVVALSFNITLQEKSNEIADLQYKLGSEIEKRINNENAPKFEGELLKYFNKNSSSFSLILKNVSENNIYNIDLIELNVFHNGKIVSSNSKLIIDKRSLSSNELTKISVFISLDVSEIELDEYIVNLRFSCYNNANKKYEFIEIINYSYINKIVGLSYDFDVISIQNS